MDDTEACCLSSAHTLRTLCVCVCVCVCVRPQVMSSWRYEGKRLKASSPWHPKQTNKDIHVWPEQAQKKTTRHAHTCVKTQEHTNTHSHVFTYASRNTISIPPDLSGSDHQAGSTCPSPWTDFLRLNLSSEVFSSLSLSAWAEMCVTHVYIKNKDAVLSFFLSKLIFMAFERLLWRKCVTFSMSYNVGDCRIQSFWSLSLNVSAWFTKRLQRAFNRASYFIGFSQKV